MDNKLVLEYIWLDAKDNFRSKLKIIDKDTFDSKTLPIWHYNGSATGQRSITQMEITLHPVRVYKCPLTPINYFVLCETQDPITKEYLDERHKSRKIFKKYKSAEPMFGLEQEFFMIDSYTNKPLGVIKEDNTYCENGCNNVYGRSYLLTVLQNALQMEVNVTGMSYKDEPGQASFQVCSLGIKACDDLQILRFLMQRVGELFNIYTNLHPKPIKDPNFYGSECHISFSNSEMRNSTSEEAGKIAVSMRDKLQNKHNEFLEKYYNVETKVRLTPSCGTVRIPNNANHFKYYRPASNINPYLACSKFLEVVMEE